MAGIIPAKKLNIKPGQRIAVVDAPPGYTTGELPAGVEVTDRREATPDFVLLFFKELRELEKLIPAVLRVLKNDGMFWISYPKGTPKVKTDLNRDILWKAMEKFGLAGVSMVSIDYVWSAMRFRQSDKVGK